MKRREVPVYLFTGFLDAGKTTFIQETLDDPAFNDGENTLLLVCEEGEADFIPSQFAGPYVTIVRVEEEEQLTGPFLEQLQRDTDCRKVVVEYNGMWMLDSLYNNMPRNWTVYQEMTFADAGTFQIYNSNMRNLTFDKLKSTETVVFKHFTREMDKMPFHKIVRQINRRCDIIYEYGPSDIEIDNIEDPLPFDLDADIVEISLQDYALWYNDINDEEEKYYGKTLRFRGRSLTGGGLADDEFVIGRHVMTCCVEDIQFGGLVAKWPESQSLDHGGWVEMTGTVKQEYNRMYEGKGPVFHAISVEKCEAPEEEIATFY